MFHKGSAQRASKEWRNGVAYLSRNARHRLVGWKLEPVREGLQPCCFTDGEPAVCGRVQVSSFLWFEEFGPDRECGPIPPQASEDVGRPARLVLPTLWNEI